MRRYLPFILALLILPWAALSARTASAQAAPSLYVSPDTARAGETIAVQGYGWLGIIGTPYVRGTFHNGPVVPAQVMSQGNFVVRYTIPASTPAGRYQMVAQVGSNVPIYAPLTVASAAPYMAVTPHPVSPNEIMTVTGYRFTPNAPIHVSMLVGSVPQSRFTTVRTNGEFTVQYAIPYGTPNGIYRLVAQIGTFTPIYHNFTVSTPVVTNPLLFAEASDIPGGAMVTVTGTRFTPNAPVHITVGLPSPLTTTVYTTSAGSFAANFPLPGSLPGGQYRVTAQVSTFTPVTTVLVFKGTPTR